MSRAGGRPIRTLILLLATSVAAVVVAPTTSAEESYPTPGSATVKLTGRGFGHGRGMAQYGAYRAATLGVTGLAITDRYYPGTTPGSLQNPQLRVRIEATVGDSSVVFPSAPGLTARDEQTNAQTPIDSAHFPGSSTLWRVASDAAGLRVQYRNSSAQWISITIGSKNAFGSTVRIFNNSAGSVGIQDASGGSTRTFRGNFRIHRLPSDSTGHNVSATNIVPMESYLRSVVPSESPPSWPAAALQAQAIAARSYAGYHYQHPRGSTYDICDTTACQVYSGTSTERPSTDTAVAATIHRVRMLGDAVLRAEFSSSNGGWVATGGAGHAPAGYDSWSDGSWDPSHSWSVSVPESALAAMVGPGYTLDRIVVLSRSGVGDWGGRVALARLEARSPGGTAVSKTVTGDDIRRALGLRSSFFTIAGGPDLRWQVGDAPATDTSWTTFTYGPAGAVALMGDWNGDGTATAAIVTKRGGEWRWRPINSNAAGAPAYDFGYGPTTCKPIAGDWNGDGTTTPGLACPSNGEIRWRLSNTNGTSAPALDFTYGPWDSMPVVGDWNNTGADRIGVVQSTPDGLVWKLRSATSAGPATWVVQYGATSDRPIVGDWDGNGTDTVGVTRPALDHWTWLVRNSVSTGPTSARFIAGLTSQALLTARGAGQSRPVIVGS